MVRIKSYLFFNTNVKISCLNLNKSRIINCNQNSGNKIEEFYGSEITVDKFSGPSSQVWEKTFILVTLPAVEKRLSLVPIIFITLKATATQTSIC